MELFKPHIPSPVQDHETCCHGLEQKCAMFGEVEFRFDCGILVIKLFCHLYARCTKFLSAE